jgi:ribosomal protein L40E
MRSPSVYNWRCRVCESSNAPQALHCESCGYRSPHLAALERNNSGRQPLVSRAWSFFARRWSRK